MKNLLIRNIQKILFFFLIIFLKLIKKFILIRFGELETRNIGHYSFSIDLYLHENKKNKYNNQKRIYDIWFKNKNVANYFLLNKWKKILNVFPHYFRFIWIYINKYNFGKEFLIPYRHWKNYSDKWPDVGNAFRDINGVSKKTKSHIKFDDNEINLGEKFFIDNKINKNPILFFARDAKYRKDQFDSAYRNSNIEDQSKAIEEMCKNNFCIRVGSNPEKELKIKNKNFIDYSFSKYQNEFNDLYIISKCKFLVSTGSGFDQLALLFRKPIVYVNATETEYRINPIFNDLIKLYIPKKIFSKKKNRILTFSEIFEIGAENLQNNQDYQNLELEVIDNTPDEILDVIKEMEQRISNRWITTREDEELQAEYWKLNSYKNMPNFDCRIGSKFLKNNLQLIK